jgi:hypothetical protein
MDQTVSKNFSAAKVIAIFVVVTGHWVTAVNLWFLATISLFLFGFSSSFFTARLYGQNVDMRSFWKKKVQRLGIRYWLILGVLTVLLLIQGRTIFHWHTLVHFSGLSGILNLFSPSQSALGRGLWFFTLLLFFYVLYPLLAKLLVASTRTSVLLAVTVVGLLVLNEWMRLGFSLWLTMLAFILGIYVGINQLRPSPRVLYGLMLGAPVALVLVNAVFHISALNTALLGLFALALCLHLTVPGRPLTWLHPLIPLEACLLEIYLIHSYLFVHPTGISALDFAISLVLIVFCALVLNAVATRLIAWLFAPKAAVAAAA